MFGDFLAIDKLARDHLDHVCRISRGSSKARPFHSPGNGARIEIKVSQTGFTLPSEQHAHHVGKASSTLKGASEPPSAVRIRETPGIFRTRAGSATD
jgi:hypothetical protein